MLKYSQDNNAVNWLKLLLMTEVKEKDTKAVEYETKTKD